MSDEVAPDGSPVEVYLALPAGETPEIIDSVLRPHSSILELGSGPGRITHPLVALGHDVVAVDDSAAMLAHIRGARTVRADLFSLDLDQKFDAVVAGSHLINAPDRARRLQLLEICRRHVSASGFVLIERYAPDWAADPPPSHGTSGDVGITFQPIDTDHLRFCGRVTYQLGDRTWIQKFEGRNVTDETLAFEAAAVGLRVMGWLDDDRTWGSLVPAA